MGPPSAPLPPRLHLTPPIHPCIHSKDINDVVTNENKGNPEWANMPRKFNIAVSGSRDDYAHTHINDIGLQAVPHAETGAHNPGHAPAPPSCPSTYP
jgi:hypothetical protein